MVDVSIAVAFTAGLVSFLAPCILPIVPGFLAYLAGSAGSDQKPGRASMLVHSGLYVLGFASVFAVLGVLLNTALESVAYDVQIWLSRIGGTIIIFFGLYLMGLIKIGFLEKEHRFRITKRIGSRHLTSFLFGAAFAAGWTPCVGAALGAILGLAATKPGSAFILLMAYALGLGLPFLAVGAFASPAQRLFNRIGPWLKYVNAVFGLVLIVLGVLIFTQSLGLIANLEVINSVLLS